MRISLGVVTSVTLAASFAVMADGAHVQQSTGDVIMVGNGDSLTQGYPLVPEQSYPAGIAVNHPEWTVYNEGGISYCTQMRQSAPERVDAHYVAGTPGVVVLECGTNDFAFGNRTVNDIYHNIRAHLRARRALGWKVVSVGVLPRPPAGAFTEQHRQELNGLLRDTWPEFADGFVDVDSDARIGAEGANLNPLYYVGDHIHMTAAGYAVLASLVDAELLRVIPHSAPVPTQAATFTPAPTATPTRTPTASVSPTASVTPTPTATPSEAPTPEGTMTVLTLQPDASAGLDTMIYANGPTLNFGITNVMQPGNVSPGAVRGLLQFDISALPVGATISSAVLTLVCTAEGHTTDHNIAVHRALTQWYEGAKNVAAPDPGQDGSTWNLRNANGSVAWAGGAGGASGSDWVAGATASTSITGVGSFTWNVTTDVQAWYGGTATNYGWWVLSDAEGASLSYKSLATSDNATAGNRPKLVITYSTGAGLPVIAWEHARIFGP